MKFLSPVVTRFLADEDGPAAVECAVMLSLIVAVCLTAIAPLGLSTRDICNAVCHALGRN
jgi:pilus assembly protein Flp/PilA